MQYGADGYASIAVKECVADFGFVATQKSFAAVTDLYASFFSGVGNEIHQAGELLVGKLKFGIFSRAPDGKNRENPPAFHSNTQKIFLEIGVKSWRIFTIFPVGRAAESPELQLSDEQFTRLMQFIAETRREGRIHVSYGCEGFLGGYEAEVRDAFYHCDAGITVGSVLHDGSISACPSIRANYSQGNIYNDDFWTVWSTRFEQFRNRAWMKKGPCADCKMFRYCEGNGFHLRDEKGDLLFCHYQRIVE